MLRDEFLRLRVTGRSRVKKKYMRAMSIPLDPDSIHSHIVFKKAKESIEKILLNYSFLFLLGPSGNWGSGVIYMGPFRVYNR